MRRSRLEVERLHTTLLATCREVANPVSLAGFRYVAEKSDCSVAVARRAFDFGLAKDLRPIRDLLDEERLLARSALRKESVASLVTQATEDARADAVESRRRTGRLIVSLQECLIEVADAFRAAQTKPLAARIAAGEPVELSPLAATLRNLIASADQLLRQEALVLGEPTQIIAGQLTVESAQAEISVEEARAELEAAQRALREVEGSSNVEAPDASGPAILH